MAVLLVWIILDRVNTVPTGKDTGNGHIEAIITEHQSGNNLNFSVLSADSPQPDPPTKHTATRQTRTLCQARRWRGHDLGWFCSHVSQLLSSGPGLHVDQRELC